MASRPLKLRALDAIADTFAPGSAAQGVPDAFLERLVARLPRSEQARLSALLSLFAARGFHRLPRARRERILRAWGSSRISLRRTGFHALRKGVLLLAWTLPGAAWDELGYPGPPGPDPEAPAKPLRADRGRGSSPATSASSARAQAEARRRSTGGRGPRRRRPRGRGLPRAAGLRRRRAGRARADVPGRRHRGERRPGRRDPRGLVPRRRHRRQLHDLVPDARRRARGVGRAVRDGRLHAQPRRGLGAARGERRAQPRPRARGEAARRARAARLARRRDAPRRPRLRAGAHLRLLPVRLPARREAVQRPDLARRRREGRCPDRRRRARRADRFRPARRSRRADGPGPRGRSRLRGDQHTGAAAPLGPRQLVRRPQPLPPPGRRGARVLRRGDPAVGGDDAGALLERARRPRLGLRRSLRDDGRPPGLRGGVPALARRRRPP